MNSMTGYGRGEVSAKGYCFVVEMRSENHRFCEIMVKSRISLLIEERIKSIIKENIKRGRIDVRVSVEKSVGSAERVKFDKDLAITYHKEIKNIGELLHLDDKLHVRDIVILPGVIETEKPTDDIENLWTAIKEAVNAAVHQLQDMRSTEGDLIAADIKKRIINIKQRVDEISDRLPDVVKEYRLRLKRRINELKNGLIIDDGRIESEVVLFTEKLNITEELVKLNSHIVQLAKYLNVSEPVGRRLDFLIQEINREINTIGSKSTDVKIAEMVIDIKSELEKIREQVQNIE